MNPRDPKDEPAYRAFCWELVRVRKSLTTLLDVAQGEVIEPLDAATNLDAPGLDSGILKFFSDSARVIREDLSAVVRHNCTGAALQIVYPLFESFIIGIGEKPGFRIRAGAKFGEVSFAELLWAGRNAFAHADEWKRTSFERDHAKESARILRAAGFAEPENINLFDLYVLMGDGDADLFISRVSDTARDLVERTPAAFSDPNALKTAGFLILAGILLVLWAVTNKTADGESDDGVAGTLAFAYPVGGQMVMVPLAEGMIANPHAIKSAIRTGAIDRLSDAGRQPFSELDALLESCLTDFVHLVGLRYDDPTYAQRLLDLANRAERLKPMFDALPNPVTFVAAERGLSTLEELTALLGEILSDSKFTSMPFKELLLPSSQLIRRSIHKGAGPT